MSDMKRCEKRERDRSRKWRNKDLCVPLHLTGADKRMWPKATKPLSQFINSESPAQPKGGAA